MVRRLFVIGLSMFMAAGARAQMELPFEVESITSFDEPWALAFLPDGRMLVTAKKGNLFIVTQDGEKSRDIDGMPDVAYGGQGGLGDVAPHPNFLENHLIYLSYAESGVGDSRGAAVARVVLNETRRGGELSDFEVIWRQYPKVVGYGHYGQRLLFDDGCLRCLLLAMCTYPFAKKELTLYLPCREGRERYFDCNLTQRKVLASSHQHLMAEAPRRP